MEITVNIQLETFEESKKLLEELEALHNKYPLNQVTITIIPQANCEEFYTPIL